MESLIGEIASGQHGVVTRAQALAVGVSDDQLRHRLRTGALLKVHPGVYRVGHRAPSLEARYMAAVKACGRDAVLSGLSAAHLLGLTDRAPATIEVTAPTERRVAGIRVRRARRGALETTIVRGIPVTTAPRTLVDIAASLDSHDLARACHEASVRYRCTPDRVEAVLARRPTSPGAEGLRRVLHGDVEVSLSKLERRFIALLREEGLKLPETNVPASGRRVDCRWPEQRLTVELDGYRYHRSRYAWERDRRREREAHARGDEFRRYTYGDVLEDSTLMLAELRSLLPQELG